MTHPGPHEPGAGDPYGQPQPGGDPYGQPQPGAPYGQLAGWGQDQPQPGGYPQQGGYGAPQVPPAGGYPQAYGQPYGGYPYGYVPPQRTNGMAVASMVLGILWLYWIGSILALIFGYVAKRQIAERQESGGGMATAGIVLGWIGIGFLVLLIVFGVAASSGA